jgi:hypothetical protein
MEQVEEATIVYAEVPNLSLNEPSLTARAEPDRRDARRGRTSRGSASSLNAQDEEAGRVARVWEKVVEEGESSGREEGRAEDSNRACEPWRLTVAARASAGRKSVAPPRRYRRFLDCRLPDETW